MGRIGRGRVRIRWRRRWRWCWRSCGGRIRRGGRGGWCSSWPSVVWMPVPSESGVYRALVRLNLIDPDARRPRDRKWKRWERGTPMELWQMDVVGGFVLADGTKAKALTGVDDHSRFCVSAWLMPRESSRQVCEGLALAMRRWGVPGEILTDNGKVFTGRFNQPPAEVLFDRICRENGITHRLTQPRSPTTTGKIERFHRSLRAEFRTDRVFKDLAAAQAELDEWVVDYNTNRPHQAIGMVPPAERFGQQPAATVTPIARPTRRPDVPRQRRVGRAASQRGRGGVRELATGQRWCRGGRPEHRRVGHRRRLTVLRRRPPAANRATPQQRPRPQEASLDSHQDRPPKPNQRVKDQPKLIRQPSTEARHGPRSSVFLRLMPDWPCVRPI